MKHVNNKKIGRHTTVIDAAFKLVKKLCNHPDVKKMALGVIKSAKKNRSGLRVKTTETQSGLRMMVRGNIYVQEIFIVTGRPDEVAKFIQSNI